MSSIKITSPADYSMATSLANANAILNEIMPEITKLNEALTGSVIMLVLSNSISLALILGFVTMIATPPFRVFAELIASHTLMLGCDVAKTCFILLS